VILPYISRHVGYRSTDKSWIFRRRKNGNRINLVGYQVHLATSRASEVPSLTPLVCVFSFIKLDARHHCHFSRQVLIFHVTLSLLPANINDASVIVACRNRRLSFRFSFSVRYLDNVPNVNTDNRCETASRTSYAANYLYRLSNSREFVPLSNITRKFYIHDSVHRNSRLKKSNEMQQNADIYLLLNYCTCFGRPSRPSSGVNKTIVAASGTDHIMWGAGFLQRGQIRTDLEPSWSQTRLQLQFYVLLIMGGMDARIM